MISFSVYPRRGDPRNYRVIVFDSKAQMQRYRNVSVANPANWMGPGRRGKERHEAIACYRDSSAFGKRLSERGEIHFHKGRIGGGIVAHEMTHAASYFLEKDCRMKPGSRRWDEAQARSVGELVRQFWMCFWRCRP